MTLVPVDYDPFAQPPKTKRAPAPTPDVYEPTSAFVRSLGPGYRDTSDYRSEAKERQLGAEGAGVARGISNHSRGTPQAPGAHDIVPTGDWNQALDRVRGRSGVKDAFIEAAHGPEGRHIHVDMTPGYRGNAAAPAGGKLTPVDYNPFAAQPAAGKGKLTPVDYNPFATAPTPKPTPAAHPHPASLIDETVQAFTDIPKEVGKQTRQSQDAVRKDLTTPYAQGGGRILDVLLRPGELDWDLFNQAMAPITGALTSIVGRPAEKTTGLPREITGNIVAAALPFLGEANDVRAAAAFAKESGLPIDIARMVLDRVRAMPRERPPTAARTPPKEAPAELQAGGDLAAPKTRLQTYGERRLLSPRREGPLLKEGQSGEKVRDTLTRHEDGLYRLQTSSDADRVEAQKALGKLEQPKQTVDWLPPKEDDLTVAPADRERLYHAIEDRMVNPAKAIPEDLKPAYAALRPRLERQQQLRADIKEMSPNALKGDDAEQGDVDKSGYIHRVRADKSRLFNPQERKDPITGGMIRAPGKKSLSRFASSAQERKYFMLQNAAGERSPAPANPDGWKVGQAHTGTNGEPYQVTHATTAEIEAMDPNARYVKDPFVNTELNILDLERVKRNIEYMQTVIPDLVDRDLAVRKEWRYKDADGKWQTAVGNRDVPEGWTETSIPELKGTYFHPRIAKMFKDFENKQTDEPLWAGLQNANRLLIGSLFWNPIMHDFNIANMWAVGRGWNWVTPQGWRSLLVNGTRAIEAVLGQNDDYVRALREGVPLQFSRAANADFYKLMIRKAGMEIEANPTGWDRIAKDFGFKGVKDLVAGYYREAQKAMWKVGDVLLMQRWFELMQNHGMNMDQARVQAGREIADYRIPTEAFGHRAVTNILKNPATVFNNYHYNVFKAYAAMARDVAKGTPEERKQALGRLFVLGVMGFVIAPIANKALQKATGNPNAKVRGAGMSALPDRLIELNQGQKEAADIVGSYITPSPSFETAFEWTFGRGRDWTGRPIVEPDASALGKGVEAGEYATSKFPPAQTIMSAAKPQGLGQTLAGQVDIDLPSARTEGGRAYGAALRKKDAARREAKDPIEQAVKHIMREMEAQ